MNQGLISPSHAASSLPSIKPVYAAEALASVAANLLMTGIFFYTAKQFGWGAARNLLLASGQGAVYTLAAMAAGAAHNRWGARRTLLVVSLAMVAVEAVALALPRVSVVVAVAMVYSALSALQWPVMESLASTGAAGAGLSRRLTRYNVTWSAANALALGGCGFILQSWPAGLFVVAIAGNLATAAVVGLCRLPGVDASPAAEKAASSASEPPEQRPHASVTEILWLSRIALPSSYVVVYSLSALMPTLPVLRPLAIHWRTLVGSVWFTARCITFGLLGVSTRWHQHPRLMLLAAGLMLIAFLGTVLRPGDLLPILAMPAALNVLLMILWQILLGAAMGLIYAASLYFGMVLSQGSTEHGGYHEALIGVGSTLGPAAAAAAHHLQPNGVGLSAAAVAGLIGISLAGAVAVSVANAKKVMIAD